jgi:hypothetical protein
MEKGEAHGNNKAPVTEYPPRNYGGIKALGYQVWDRD